MQQLYSYAEDYFSITSFLKIPDFVFKTIFKISMAALHKFYVLIIQLNLAVFELPKIKNALFYGNLIMQSYGLWQGLIGGAVEIVILIETVVRITLILGNYIP